MTNMHEIGSAFTAYYDEYKYYPSTNPMGTLVSAGKLAAIKTCPLDSRTDYDTYSDLYNYWGYYAPAITPQPLTQAYGIQFNQALPINQTAQGLASQVYGNGQQSGIGLPISGLQQLVNVKGEWSSSSHYNAFDSVTVTNNEQSQYYLCYASAVNYTTNINIQPGVSANWSHYWKLMSARWWNNQSNCPDSDFPGLANANCPGLTIITVCAHHLENGGKYVILRKDGSVDYNDAGADQPDKNAGPNAGPKDIFLQKPGDLFWALSLKP